MSHPAKAAIFILVVVAAALAFILQLAKPPAPLPVVQDRVVSLDRREPVTVESYLVDVAREAGAPITITGNSDGMVSSYLKGAKVVDIFDNACVAYGCVWGIDEDERIWVEFWAPAVEAGAP